MARKPPKNVKKSLKNHEKDLNCMFFKKKKIGRFCFSYDQKTKKVQSKIRGNQKFGENPKGTTTLPP
jgi:hypothetical protein